MPAWWVDVPVPFTAALMFRVGRADEMLTTGGVSHLVEHLALSRVGPRPYQYNGFVDHTRTVFWAKGRTPEDVAEFLAIVCATLASLPLDRLEVERRVLRIEAEGKPTGTHSQVWSRRFGAMGYGLIDHAQWGLRWLDAAHVSAWAAERFTRGNAILFASGPIPPSLRLSLPDGKRFAPPVPRSRVETPAHYVQGTSFVATTMLSPGSLEGYLAAALLGQRALARLRLEMGASYSVTTDWVTLTAARAYLLVSADGAKDRGTEIATALTATFEELLREGPSEERLAELREAHLRTLDAPLAAAKNAEGAATNELLGGRHATTEERRAKILSVTRDEVRAALGQAATTALLAIPQGTKPPDGHFASPIANPTSTRVAGEDFLPWSLESDARTIVGDEGISHTSGPNVLTVSWEHCVGVFVNRLGWHEVVEERGYWLRLSPWDYAMGKALVDALRAHLRPELFIGIGDDPDAWLALWTTCDRQLQSRGSFWREILELVHLLEPEERIAVLAGATLDKQPGLLAAGNRRIFHVARGRPKERRTIMWRYDKITKPDGRARWAGFAAGRLSFVAGAREVLFTRIEPKERATAMLEVVRREMEQISRPAGIGKETA